MFGETMKSPAAKTVFLAAVLVLAATAFAGWGVYATFIAGRTGGPDFIQAVQAGSFRTNTISSIEVVEPMIGSMPFTANEYEPLKRRGKIDSMATISRLLSPLLGAEPGGIPQNHPVSTNRAYLKVNTQRGFFWVYCVVLRDANGSVLVLDSNRRNATNPNAASTYHLMEFSEVLGIIEGFNNTEPGGVANGSQPIRSKTNRPSSSAGSRR
jgi:hypothetical protein